MIRIVGPYIIVGSRVRPNRKKYVNQQYTTQ